VKEILRSLPRNLDATYTQMLTRIKKMYQPEALTLLRWLAYARSPPTLGELVDAAITDPDREDYIEIDERGGLRDVLNILSGLVMLEESTGSNAETSFNTRLPAGDTSTSNPGSGQGGTFVHSQHPTAHTRVRLSHFSVKEYLESDRILRTKADQFHLESAIGHQTLAQSCLTYLRHYSTSREKTSTKQDLEIFPLLWYAARSWFYHSALQRDMTGGREASFLQLENARNDWLFIYEPDRPWEAPLQGKQRTDLGSSMYYASLLGLPAVVSSLMNSGADINAQGGAYDSALQVASWRGHTKTVQLLVDLGADVDAQGGECGSALQAALLRGNTKIVQLLVDNGADVNAQGGAFDSALQAASHIGDTKIVQLLIDKGANINAQGERHGSAVQVASWGGHTKTVQLLVDLGADANAQGGHHNSAIQAASFRGYTEIVQLLVDNGADVNAKGGFLDSALQSASEGGNTAIVQLLVDNGADVNAQGGEYGNALQAASLGGNTAIVQLLVDNGADVNA
jgi:ankyrin repeat protein